jgi:hypothetical protein
MTHEPQIHAKSYESFLRSQKRSIKHSTYFAVYDHLFSKYIGKPITFVEIGVLDGGSLFMWRDFFGPQARIIGIELNPGAEKWRQDGFEIYIGSQSDPRFWADFFDTVGAIDVLLDDGGHTYEQQIKTVEFCLPHIKDQGLLVVEDTHTSYMKGFGIQGLSLLNYAYAMADRVNHRFSELPSRKAERRVWGIRIYESFVVFEINRSATDLPSTSVQNGGEASHELDYRYSNGGLADRLERLMSQSGTIWAVQPFRAVIRKLKKWAVKLELVRRSLSVRRYF